MSENQTSRCLVPSCENPPHKRGICGTHYNAFLQEKNKLPKQKHAEFERLAVKEGLLKPAELGGRPKASNPFAVLAGEMSTEQKFLHF